jgi:hypothetical protein
MGKPSAVSEPSAIRTIETPFFFLSLPFFIMGLPLPVYGRELEAPA